MRALVLALFVMFGGIAAAKNGGSAIGVSVPSTTCEGRLDSESGERITARLTTTEKSPSMTVIFRGDRLAADGYSRLLPSFTALGKERLETQWFDDGARFRLIMTWATKRIPTELRILDDGEETIFRGTLSCR